LIGLRERCAWHEARELVGDIDSVRVRFTLSLLDVYGLEYQVDFGIARGLDYYTGMVFEIYCEVLARRTRYVAAELTGLPPCSGRGYAFDRIMLLVLTG